MASDKLIELAGYVLAEALLQTSDAGGGEGRAFDPFGGIVRDGELQMVQFGTESERFQDAAEQALDYLTEHADEYMARVLATDIILLDPGNASRLRDIDPDRLDMSAFERSDCIAITAWEHGLDEPVTIHQRYTPPRSGGFRLIGPPMFARGGETLAESEVEEYLPALESGILHHSDAAARWESWTQA